ncbi:OsmC family protein [Spirosoma rhododendri]|uniref:OsmC family protein n=1 Tax=Spirosoma rhododendri TaxID=2728024 RepID=A0A7L5DWK9_9BACT|nr:OsmC family protein [Spirosoma rhododendri]QJD79930.1 OsmC family protein [Spirosoma rhododendri]
MPIITARIERTPYETHLTTGTQVIVSDEPTDVGGQDRGMKPGELLAGSLAACTAITLRMYADRKAWPLDTAVVHVDYSHDREHKRSRFEVQLVLTGDLTDEQRMRLLEIADKCPIHQVLEHPAEFSTTLAGE